MRDLVRLVAVAAMSFAVVGLAMVYSRGDDLVGMVRSMSTSLAASVSPAAAPQHKPIDETRQTVTVYRPDPAEWVGLAGFPDQAEVTFPLRRGIALTGGALELALESQLTQTGDGLLTLSVNGSPRGQVVLEGGQARHAVRVDLTPGDLAGDSVVLHLAGRGNTGGGQVCPTDGINAGSAVTVLPESRLELMTDAPLDQAMAPAPTASDRLAIATGTTSEEMALAIWANQYLDRAGVTTHLGQAQAGEIAFVAGLDPAATTALRATSKGFPAASSWPVTFDQIDSDLAIKSFRGTRQWLVDFSSADLPGGKMPEATRVVLSTAPLSAGSEWVVRVSLNGNLIESRRLPGTTTLVDFEVALPAERLAPPNRLGIELVDTTPKQGVCGQVEQAQAQLMPESALIDTAATLDGWPALVERLATTGSIALEVDAGYDLQQAGEASALLGKLLPRDAVPVTGAAEMTIAMTTRAGLAQHLAANPDTDMVAVLPVRARVGAGLTALPMPSAALGSALEALDPDDVILLVSGS